VHVVRLAQDAGVGPLAVESGLARRREARHDVSKARRPVEFFEAQVDSQIISHGFEAISYVNRGRAFDEGEFLFTHVNLNHPRWAPETRADGKRSAREGHHVLARVTKLPRDLGLVPDELRPLEGDVPCQKLASNDAKPAVTGGLPEHGDDTGALVDSERTSKAEDAATNDRVVREDAVMTVDQSQEEHLLYTTGARSYLDVPFGARRVRLSKDQ
jgi:hypothetical protein